MEVRIIGCLLMLGWVSSCGYREVKTGISPTYQSIQATIIQPKCVECHTSLSSYAGLSLIVQAGNPERSEFYKEIKEGSMPLHSTKLSDAEIQAVYDWIKSGAQND